MSRRFYYVVDIFNLHLTVPLVQISFKYTILAFTILKKLTFPSGGGGGEIHINVINGGSLNSLEKLIPILLECGTIIIDTHSSQTALHDIFRELVEARKEIDFELIRISPKMSVFCDEQSKHGTPLFNIVARIRDHMDQKLLVYVDSVNLRQKTDNKEDLLHYQQRCKKGCHKTS